MRQRVAELRLIAAGRRWERAAERRAACGDDVAAADALRLAVRGVDHHRLPNDLGPTGLPHLPL